MIARAATKTWPFTTPGEYVYDSSKIEVAGGVADLITQNWMNDSWAYRRRIIVDNTAGSAQTNFQTKVTLDSSNFDFANARADGFDIRFTDADKKTTIFFWRSAYDSVAQTATFWVSIPTLLNAATQDIYIYYGNFAAADASTYSDVFTQVGEFGIRSQNPIGSAFTAINFSAALSVTPVVVSTIQTAVDSPTSVTPFDICPKSTGGNCAAGPHDGTAEPQITNVTAAGFQERLMPKSIDCDGVHGVENFAYLALVPGTYRLGGRVVSVFTHTLGNSSEALTNNISYGITFPDLPVVLGQLQTWDTVENTPISVRLKNITVNDFSAKIEEDGEGQYHPTETGGFIVIDQAGADDILENTIGSGLDGEVGSTGEGRMNDTWQTTGFQHAFSFAPVVILKAQNENGGNNGQERIQSITTTTFQQKFEENFYSNAGTCNFYDGYHTNDEGGAFIALGSSAGAMTVPASFALYARKYQSVDPTATVQAVESYNNDPTIKPSLTNTVSFDNLSSFTQTLGAGTGNVRYQISNDAANWYYFATSTTSIWTNAATEHYYLANTAAEVNANSAAFVSDIGPGSFYFKAFLHAPTENDDIALDQVDIDYTVPAAAPDISAIAPNPAPIYADVIISGSDFGLVQGASKVYFNGCDATAGISSWSATSITVKVPTCASNGPVTVIVGPYISNESAFTISTPNITFIDPPTADIYQLVNVYGSNFGYTQGTSYVSFADGASGVNAIVLSWSNNAISCRVPPGAITGNVNVVTAGGTSNSINFTITPDTSRWPFTTPANYTYGPLVTDTGGMAETVTVNSPSWLDRKWLYRRLIQYDNNAGKPAGFQVLLQLTAANFPGGFAKCKADGSDIRFTRADGTTAVDSWIESWDSSAQTATVWIETPALASENSVYIYYGNASAAAISSATQISNTLNLIGQAGTTTKSIVGTNSWTAVTMTGFTSAPVVMATQVSKYDTRESHVRIKNVAAGSFSVAIENARGSGTTTHNAENVSWIAISPGSWYIGGLHVEAGTFGSLNRTAANVTFGAGRNFAGAPAVLVIQQTANTTGGGTDNSTQVRANNVATTGFSAKLERDNDTQPASFTAETGGYIAIDSGTMDDSLPNLNGGAGLTTFTMPNMWNWQSLDLPSTVSLNPAVVATIDTTGAEAGENPAHTRIKNITGSSFQVQNEECTNGTGSNQCTEGHVSETDAWLGIEPGQIYGRMYSSATPNATVNAEENPQYSSANPTINPKTTDGESYSGIAGFFELTGYENAGSVRYQVTNDQTFGNWYWHDGAAWGASSGFAQTNTWQELNTNLPTFDAAFGTGKFYFKAFMVSDGSQLVQIDGIGIIKRSNKQTIYEWATNSVATPVFYEDNQPASVNAGMNYIAAIQVEHDGSLGTYNFQLQYRTDPFGVTPGAWTSIQTSGTDWIAIDGPWGNHGANVLTSNFKVNGGSGTGTAVDGKYSETGVVTAYQFASGTYYSEFWYAIQPTTSAAGNVYQFRMVDGTSSAGFSYDNYPLAGPAPDPLTIAIADTSGITNDTTPALTLTCFDNADGANCDASDFMRFACDEASLPGAPWVAFSTSYSSFDMTTGPGCNSADGPKTIYFQAKNQPAYDYLQLTPASDTTYYDTTPPDFIPIDVTSDSPGEYFYGSPDITCRTSLGPPACTVWFNNLAGEGAGQNITVRLLDSDITEVNKKSFSGVAAFNDTPAADVSPTSDWTQAYSVEAGTLDQLGRQFTFYDLVNNSLSFQIDFRRDVDYPDAIAPDGYDTSGKAVTLISGGWGNYPNPYFEWA
ncbi:MAG: DUF2341 domain-containing protein, partial [bacterium]